GQYAPAVATEVAGRPGPHGDPKACLLNAGCGRTEKAVGRTGDRLFSPAGSDARQLVSGLWRSQMLFARAARLVGTCLRKYPAAAARVVSSCQALPMPPPVPCRCRSLVPGSLSVSGAAVWEPAEVRPPGRYCLRPLPSSRVGSART